MFRARICAFMGFCLMLAPASSEARELRFSVENRVGGNDNVFRSNEDASVDKKADGFWEIAPRLSLAERRGDLTYALQYQPTYEQYFSQEGVSGFDHAVFGNANWRLSGSDALSASGQFASTRRLRQDFADLGSTSGVLQGSDRERIKLGRGRLEYSRYFSPALVGRTSYAIDDLDYSRRSLSDSRSHTGSVGVNYVLDQLTVVGVTLAGRFRNSRVNQQIRFSGVDLLFQEIRSSSNTADISFLFSRGITPTVSISASAGPSLIYTEQEVIPTNPFLSKS